MPFIADTEPGFRPDVVAPPAPPAPTGDALSAAFRQQNSVVSYLNSIRNQGQFEPDPNHNPLDLIRGTPYEAQHLDRFAGSRSAGETRSIMGEIDQEEADRRSLAAAGFGGVLLQMLAGGVDPTVLLPGGAVADVAKGGYVAARSAVSVARAMAVQSIIQEALLHGSQETRPLSESVLNVGSATLLGSLLGAGASRLLSTADHAAMVRALDRDRAAMDAHAAPTPAPEAGVTDTRFTPAPGEPVPAADLSARPEPTGGVTQAAPAGAAVADARVLEPVGAFGLEKVPFDPTLRTLSQPSIAARRAYGDLAELSVLTKDNLKGDISTSGGAPLESIYRTQNNRAQVQLRDTLKEMWGDLRFNGATPPRAAQLRDRFGLLPGEGPTFEQFKGMVSDAMMAGDKHEIPQVAQAAQYVRAQTEPWVARAEAAIPDFQREVPKAGEGHFWHDWNKTKIAQQRPVFVEKLTDKYVADQATKAAAKQRIEWLDAQLGSWNSQIAKLEARFGRADQRAKIVGAKAAERGRDEIPKTVGFNEPPPKDRLTELKTRQINIAAEASDLRDVIDLIDSLNAPNLSPALRTNIEKLQRRVVAEKVVGGKFDEAARTAKRSEKRLAELERQLGSTEDRKALIEEYAATAEQIRDEIRTKLENEIAAWEGKSAGEAKSALKAREKYAAEQKAVGKTPGAEGRLTGADAAVDTAVKRIIKKPRDLSREDLRGVANETVDRILSSPDGRLPYDQPGGAGPSLPGEPLRGSLHTRLLDVSNEFARDWIERDIEEVFKRFNRTFMPDVLLSERFGDVEMSAAFRAINEDYARLADAAKTDKARAKLEAQRQRTIEDVAAVRDRLRGLYAIPATASQRRIGRVSLAARNAMVPLNMGASMLSSIPDAAGTVFQWGLGATLRDGWAPFLGSLMRGGKYSREAMREAKVAGIAIDTATAQRHHEFAGVMDTVRPGSPLEKTLQWGADKFQIANLLGPWTDMVKTISFTVNAQNLYRAAKAATEGKASAKQLTKLGASNISRDLYGKIVAEYEKSGSLVDGVLLPNTETWPRELREVFEGALARNANINVVTPGLDKPLFMSDPTWAVLTQFKSFTAAATTRILISNLQRSDAQTLQGLVASLALGMVSYKLNSITGGSPTSDRPQDWIKEGMSRGNIFGWLEEGNALASKMTRGGVDAYRLIGSDRPLSRYANRTALDQLLGPTFGKLGDLAKVTGATASRDWKASDVKAMRRMTIGQNLFYLRGLFNQMEGGADNAFGLPIPPASTAAH